MAPRKPRKTPKMPPAIVERRRPARPKPAPVDAPLTPPEPPAAPPPVDAERERREQINREALARAAKKVRGPRRGVVNVNGEDVFGARTFGAIVGDALAKAASEG